MSITAVPHRTSEQRAVALAKANRIRFYRAELKRDIAAGRALVQERITDPECDVETMRVFDLLLAMPKVGRVKANQILRRASVSPSKTFGGLSDRQRRELLVWLPSQATRVHRRTREAA